MTDPIEDDDRSPNLAAGEYDLLPYHSVPYRHTQPPHIAAIAKLFGIDAPDPVRARVLELGCASGGNIIPLAARFPEADFVGIDLSERQVADGQARIAALGLSNIEIRHGDIATADLSSERFDYTICHGVYSWVPPETQDAVFRIPAETLTPNGVAYVSYNTYPGWHLRTIVRDICLFHAGKTGAPEVRVERARWALEKLAQFTDAKSLYGQLLRGEAETNASLPDSYILGEFLATLNAPCYFHEFATRANAHGLRFLSEADFVSSVPEAQDREAARLARQIAGRNGIALEQYMDFFTGRQFRRSLLVRSGSSGVRHVGPEHVEDLHFSSQLRREETARASGKAVFKADGGALAVDDPVTSALLDALQNAFPGTCTIGEIVERVAPTGKQPVPELMAAVRATLFNLIASGQIEVSAIPLQVGRATDSTFEVWPLARSEAASGQGWLTTLRHEPASLEKGLARIVALFDGTRDRQAVAKQIGDDILSGTISIGGLDRSKPITDEQLAKVSARVLDQLLVFLERNALLLA